MKLLTLMSFLFVVQLNLDIRVSCKRVKRYLKFPKGAQFTVTIAISTFLPKDLPMGFAHIIEFDYGYPFPDQILIDKPVTMKEKPFPVIHWSKSYSATKPKRRNYLVKRKNFRRSRSKSQKEVEREFMLTKLKEMIERLGYDGASCVSRFLCDLSKLSSNRSVLEDVLLVLFGSISNCDLANDLCSISVLQSILHMEQLEENDFEL